MKQLLLSVSGRYTYILRKQTLHVRVGCQTIVNTAFHFPEWMSCLEVVYYITCVYIFRTIDFLVRTGQTPLERRTRRWLSYIAVYIIFSCWEGGVS